MSAESVAAADFCLFFGCEKAFAQNAGFMKLLSLSLLIQW